MVENNEVECRTLTRNVFYLIEILTFKSVPSYISVHPV